MRSRASSRGKGFRVFLGARDEKAGEAAAEKLRAEGALTPKDKTDDKIEFLKIDITNIDSIRRAAEEFGKQGDRLDVLVNNAGILFDDDKDVLTITPEIFETTLRTNTLGALLVSQAFVPFLKKSDAPRIVNVSSGGGQLTMAEAIGRRPIAFPRPRSTVSPFNSPPSYRTSRLTLSVPAGFAPIWAAPTPHDPSPRVHPGLCG